MKKFKYIYIYNKIREGIQKHKKTILVPEISTIIPLLDILTKKGLIRGFVVNKKEDLESLKRIKIFLKYDSQERPVLNRISFFAAAIHKNSLCIYKLKALLYHFSDSSTIFIFSTSKGLLTHFDCLKYNVGGDLIFKIN